VKVDQGQNMLSPFVDQHLTVVFRLSGTCCGFSLHALNGTIRIAPDRKAAGATLLVIGPEFFVKRSINQLSGGRCSN
jgi:hypothetical protein